MGEMNERRSDFELLQRFTHHGEQPAFADLVRRHLDLVFATALRKLADPGAAQEVAQNVFTALARKAWQFAPDDSLPAWLHKTALLESKSWLRGELRRRRREQTAAELGTTMKTLDEQPAFNGLVPLLDEALLSLREKDRTALLLRFYESQSLRDVGASLGVGEDAAQKRVQSALEKLSDFFQRRGFKTATVAAAMAALQNTAASASAATASAVVSAALQTAPPALAGLGAVVARLASLNKMQTAAVCVAIAAGPVTWQWNESQAAAGEARQIQIQLEAARAEQFTLLEEIERVSTTSARLEDSLASRTAAATRQAEEAQKFAMWKTRIRQLMTAAEYRWPDDSPFVRIPKSALTQIDGGEPLRLPGVITPTARELLGLTRAERESAEGALQDYFSNLDRLIDARLYETNRPLHATIPTSAVASKIIVVPPLGEEAKEAVNRLMASLSETLGKERWALAAAPFNSQGFGTPNQILKLNAAEELQQIVAWISPGERDEPTVVFQLHRQVGMFGTPGIGLANFLPDAEGFWADAAARQLSWGSFPESVVNRLRTWLQQQAVERLGKEAKQ